MGSLARYHVTEVANSSEPDGLCPSDLPRTRRHGLEKPFFRSAQWSADGSTIFTKSSANRVSSFVVPPDLLSPRESPLTLRPQGTIVLQEPSAAIAPCPSFSILDAGTQVLLTACSQTPIQMLNCFPQAYANSSEPQEQTSQAPVLGTYPLKIPETEAYPLVAALIWPWPNHLVAGAKDLIAVFDVNRPGANIEPYLRIKTIPSRRHISKGHGVGIRGTVSALAAQPGTDVIAAGMWSRKIGLYDMARGGETVTMLGVENALDGLAGEEGSGQGLPSPRDTGGRGIAQLLWSPCGKYLLVNERKAHGLLVYDMRMSKLLAACLTGRASETSQRLSCDVLGSKPDFRRTRVVVDETCLKLWSIRSMDPPQDSAEAEDAQPPDVDVEHMVSEHASPAQQSFESGDSLLPRHLHEQGQGL
ncbi:hypothetical protein P8C59_005035 [Phyllachora maydis]|uniref:Uncharacterized protein n=1 Tax=Phyllachora maydis TaxID=1825666 RepID=A0AAD9I4V4_9PEZI|nr:hypothetical protein P8C59_005035 [Phyllachora maydis]